MQLFPENIIRDLWLLWPEIAVAALTVVLLTVQMAFGKNGRNWSSWIVAPGLAAILTALIALPVGETQVFFSEMLLESPLTRQFQQLLVSGTLFTILLGQIFPSKAFADEGKPEYYTLICGALLGLLLMVRAQNLLMLFMALETVSICSYGLVFFVSGKRATEAGVKYILFGIFSSALMLYGISLWWSMGGSLNLTETPPTMLPEWGLALVFLLILTGLLFKTSVTPFHIWTPDVFEGAPLPVATFFAIVPKTGALAAVIMLSAAVMNHPLALSVLVIVAIVTLLTGTLAAIRQTNMRRLMAYSAIAQAGFLLAAVIAQAPEALIYYLWAYLLMNFAAFSVMAWVENVTHRQEITAFAGAGTAVPLAGITMLTAMAALIGLPPTSGFAAKLLVFSALWQQWQQMQSPLLLSLFITGLGATVVSVYFYFKVPYQMFFREGEGPKQRLNVLQSLWLAAFAIALIALLLLNR